jgi:hypothetical protein
MAVVYNVPANSRHTWYGCIWQPDPGSGPTCGGPAEEGETRRGGEGVTVSLSPPLLVSRRGAWLERWLRR